MNRFLSRAVTRIQGLLTAVGFFNTPTPTTMTSEQDGPATEPIEPLGYTLRVPFRLPDETAIRGPATESQRRFGDFDYQLESDPPFRVLKVEGFKSEQEAREYFQRLWTALLWVLLDQGLAIEAHAEIRDATYPVDPVQAGRRLRSREPVDVVISANEPAVYPTEGRMKRVKVQDVFIYTAVSEDEFFVSLFEGLGIDGQMPVGRPPRLETSLSLFRASFYENSPNARFITLIMALEVLSEGQPKHPVALQLMDEWLQQLEKRKQQYEEALGVESDEYEALEALGRETIFRQESSLRSRVRKLVLSTLEAEGNARARSLARRAVELYDLRSTLVHDGIISIEELTPALGDARVIASMVLKSRLLALRSAPENLDGES